MDPLWIILKDTKRFDLAIITMRDEYTNILEEMVKNDKMVQYIDGRNLLSYLQVHDVISFQEKEKLYPSGPTECTQHLVKVVLKSRKDEDMMHFLNSLKHANYNHAHEWLKEKLENSTNKHQHMQFVVGKRKAHQFRRFDVRDPTVNFIGREVELKKLHKKMLRSGEKDGADAKKIVITERTSAVTGLGGIGKTQLALRYVQLYSHYYDNNIVWINAESDTTLRNSFINLAENLNINIKHANGVEKGTVGILKDVYDHFSMVKCLFVFDNADDPLKDDFFPSSQFEIFILITSRYQKWGPVNVFYLDNFSPEEASDFILINLKVRTVIVVDEVANLAKTLHFFPLALKQATAYINKTSEIKKIYSIDDYINEYNESKKNLLIEIYKFDFDFSHEYFQTTFTTLQIIINKLGGKAGDNSTQNMKRFSLVTINTAGDMAIDILDWISYLGHEEIDMQIFVQNENNKEIGIAVQLLKEYSLVMEENSILNVHPLVQEMTQLNLKDKNTEKKTFTTVCRLVVSYFERLERSNDNYKQKILLPHSEKLLQEMKSWLIKNPSQRKHIEQESIKNLLIQMSIAYNNVGQQSQKKSICEQLLSIKIEQFGQEHYEVAKTLVSLGNAYGALGQPEKKKTLLEKALPMLEKHYGSDHYQVAITSVNLGNVYGALGQLGTQKALLEKALPIQEKYYGADHYKVAKTLVNLSTNYGALGQSEEQKIMLEKALAIQEKHYRPDHLEVAATLADLAIAYSILGHPEKVKTLMEKVLAKQNKDRYVVAEILKITSKAYQYLGETEKQKSTLEKAMEIEEKRYGKAVKNVE